LSKILFPKTLIIGLGLIGGSFAKSLRHHKISEKIFAFDLDLESIDLAKNDGVIDGGADNFVMLEENFDLVVIATPLSAYEEIFAEILNHISPKTIVIDLGSLKNFINEILPKNLEKNFIGCHPIAGSEKNGFENSEAELFAGKKFVICPTTKNDLDAVKKIENLAKQIGCNVESIDAKKHDEIYALVSHLPQFLSFLTKEFSPKNIKDDFFKAAFRLDDSDPEIWSDIFELNDENLERFYVEFFDDLEKEIALIKVSAETPKGDSWHGLESCFDELSMTSSFFEENFAAIFTRAIIVKTYLNLPQIKTFQNYAGSGFRDFTSIIKILKRDQDKLTDLIQKNHKKILKIFNSLS
jgi:prephenate dehydrogenase